MNQELSEPNNRYLTAIKSKEMYSYQQDSFSASLPKNNIRQQIKTQKRTIGLNWNEDDQKYFAKMNFINGSAETSTSQKEQNQSDRQFHNKDYFFNQNQCPLGKTPNKFPSTSEFEEFEDIEVNPNMNPVFSTFGSHLNFGRSPAPHFQFSPLKSLQYLNTNLQQLQQPRMFQNNYGVPSTRLTYQPVIFNNSMQLQ